MVQSPLQAGTVITHRDLPLRRLAQDVDGCERPGDRCWITPVGLSLTRFASLFLP